MQHGAVEPGCSKARAYTHTMVEMRDPTELKTPLTFLQFCLKLLKKSLHKVNWKLFLNLLE